MSSLESRLIALGDISREDILDKLGASRYTDIKKYFEKIKEAKENDWSILYITDEYIVFIEKIEDFRRVDVAEAMIFYGIRGEHISIRGKGYYHIPRPRSKREEEHHAFGYVEDDFHLQPLIVTPKQNPPLLISDQKLLSDIYHYLVGRLK